MSWKASAYAKELIVCPNGEKLTHLEKLMLFVLADCHNPDRHLAWPSIPLLAELCLMSSGHAKRVLWSLRDKGVIAIVSPERQGRGQSNAYAFCALDGLAESEATAKTRGAHDTPSGKRRGAEGVSKTRERGTEGVSHSDRNKEEPRTKSNQEPNRKLLTIERAGKCKRHPGTGSTVTGACWGCYCEAARA